MAGKPVGAGKFFPVLLAAGLLLSAGALLWGWLGIPSLPLENSARDAGGADLDATGPVPRDRPEAFEAIEALGYSPGFMPVPESTGVSDFDSARAYIGLNLVISGHGYEAALMDMEGNVLHRWAADADDLWQASSPRLIPAPRFMRRAHVDEAGNLVALFTDRGIAKLDKNSKVLWAREAKYHHDLDMQDDGTFFTLERSTGRLVRDGVAHSVLEDFICHFDTDGNLLRRVSVLGALEGSRYSNFLDGATEQADITHTNTVEFFDGASSDISPLFKKGNVLISCRTIDAVAIIDLDTERAVWAQRGPWKQQHSPTLLDNGRLLLFDNQGLGGRSRVIEFDPLSGQTHWTYGGGADEFFYSSTLGVCHRLPNGNTLIVESNAGRAFEVTLEKEIVWRFTNPNRIVGNKSESIAVLLDVVRLDADFPLSWLP